MTSYRYWRLWHGNEAKGSFCIVFTINLVRMLVWRMFEIRLSCVSPDVLTYPRSQELPNARVILQAIRLLLDSLVITRAWSFSTEAVLSILTSCNNYFPVFVNLTPIPFLPPILTLFSLASISLTLSLPECLMEFWKVTVTFAFVDEILWCDHSNESSLPVLTHGTFCFSKC